MDRQSILRKIKACLRLAASSNPNEAGVALRQAQTMMAKYGVRHDEISDIGEAEVSSRFRGVMPPKSVGALATICAEGFGADLMVVCGLSTVFRFCGHDGAAEIAAYAFTVLRRQLEADKRRHIARVRKRANREARGEVFALAWVAAVSRQLPKAALSEARQLELDEYIRLRYPQAVSAQGRDLTTRGKHSHDDALAGHVAGLNAKLHQGVSGGVTRGLEKLP